MRGKNRSLKELQRSGTPFIVVEKEMEPTFLSITEKNENELYVTNIVPEGLNQLSFDQYNDILQEFYQSFC